MARKKKLFTTRKKSMNELLGITKAKRKISRDTGLGEFKAALKPQQTLKRKVKKSLGYESEPVKAIRNINKQRYLFGIIPIGPGPKKKK